MAHSTETYEGLKITDGKEDSTQDVLTSEYPLHIHVNGEPFTVTMQTPGSEIFLALGLLYNEGYFSQNEVPLVSIIEEVDDRVTRLNVELSESEGQRAANKRSLLSAASCGICGKKELEQIEGERLVINSAVEASKIEAMFGTMSQNQAAFVASGGSHAAALFDSNFELLAVQEDVGRHNAVDKAVGQLLDQGILKQTQFLLVSGRVSYEIVTKCFMSRIPYLAAVSAPSTLAVDFSKEFGITLLGFCRENRCTVYSHPNRIKV